MVAETVVVAVGVGVVVINDMLLGKSRSVSVSEDRRAAATSA